MTDPAADLRHAYQRWATSPAWTLTSRSGEHDTVFSAYAPDQATGEELAGLIRTDLLL